MMGYDSRIYAPTQRGTLTQDHGLGTAPVPLDIYRSQSFFELERDRVFRRAWLMVCREEEIAAPGDFIVKTIDPCRVSALVVRSRSGKVQAFHNSCSHRGSAVVSKPSGNQPRFICPYHNWTYGNDGQLLAIPDGGNFFDVDKQSCGLKTIATDVWEGWVFINLAPEPEVSLAEFLGPFKDHFAGVKYQGAGTPVVFTADLDANWKVVSDAFIETYHIPFIHPETIGTTFASRINPFARLLSATILGPHRAVSMFGNADYQANPANKVEALAYAEVKTGSVIAAAGVDQAKEYLSHAAINPTRETYWSMDVNHIFPHTQIDCGPGGFWTHQFWPVTANTSRYEGRFYMTPASNIRERFQQELYIGRVAEVILEDLSNVARTQVGIDSGGQSHMQLQDSEIAIRHSVEQVIRWTEAATVKEALA
jgi:phenylpropionate dioxygenase-like ring-hydroxylating dioxygenase large terminal subunit